MTAGDEITVKLEKIIYHADRFEIVCIMDLLEDVLRDEGLLYRELIEDAMDAAIMFEYEDIKKYISQYLSRS